ncbi:MAG: hypothetical protein U9O86_05240, partial [Campylobacterota bacterium]|nr:hypothetical protein [Campylobacterota bacterium]
ATSAATATETFVFTDAANNTNTVNWTTNFTPDTPTLRVESPTVILTDDAQTETVTVLAFDSNNQAFNTGTILVEYPTAITDGSVSGGTFTQNEANIVNGKATFNFTGPNPLATIANQVFTFKYKENQTVSTALTMQYTPDLPQINSLAINESTTVLTQNSQTHTVVINALDANGDFVNSGTVNVKFPAEISNGTDLGTFTSFSIDITNGQASFSYTGPTDLVATSAATATETFVFTDAANNTNTVNWTTNFTPDTPTLRVESPTVILTNDAQVETVTVLAFDSANKAFSGGNIVVEYPVAITSGAVSGGTFVQAEAAIVNGKATFTFTGPNPLSQIADQIFTFKYKENQTVSTALTMEYNPSLPAITSLAINEAITTISKDNQLHTVVINALDTNGDFVNSGTINVKFPAEISNGTDLGKFTELSIAVVNGQASFSYKGPNNILTTSVATVSETFIFEDAAGLGTPVNWRVDFNPEVPVIRLTNSSITVVSDGETISVEVLAFDENNQSLNSGTISVAYPSEIINQNANGGRFLENEATVSNGIAVFSFVGPTTLTKISDLTFTFSYKGNALVATKDLLVTYSPPTASIYMSETTKVVTLNSETIYINVDVRDSFNNPFTTGSVKIVYPDDVQTGRDIGSFISSEVSLVNGTASFVYSAPKSLDSNESNITFGFYHDSEPTQITDFIVSIESEPGQEILTDYFLTSSYSDGNITMDLESTKLITFYVKDKDDNLLEDSNITSIVVTVLNTALADIDDSNATNPAAETQTLTKNSASLSIISNTISGVVPIKAIATFKGVNNENVSITEVFNVVVVSGPPTAMSISYVSTSNDSDNAKFVEKMVVAITDKYSNRVNSNPGISVALIAGYANDTSGPLEYMYHKGSATIDTTDDKIKVASGSVMQVNLTSRGSNYSIAPDVSFGAGGFEATAYLSDFGGISEVNIISGGKEYVTPPTVVAQGTGYGFSATAVLEAAGTFFTTKTSATGFAILTLDNAGTGYTSTPTVSAAGGSGFSATAVLESTGSVKSISVTSGGTGYAVGDDLIIGGDGTGATAKVSAVTAGVITAVTVFNGGSGYSVAAVDALGVGGGDAVLSATVGYALEEVRLNSGGSGYSDASLTLSNEGEDVPAQVSASIGFAVDSVTVDNIGAGYKNSATIIFTGEEDGENAMASTVVRYPVSFIEIVQSGAGYADGALTITNAAGDVTGSGAAANAEVFADFSTVVENSGTNDQFLMTFGNGYSYNASGKWDITSSGAADNFERVLSDQYEGATTTDLGFATGNNFRQDECIVGQEWVATAKTSAVEFDSNGLAEVEITYDYYLAAKDVVLSANLVGEQNSFGQTVKIGEAIKHTLRGTGLISDTLSLPSGLDHAVYRIYIELDGALDQFRNSNFTYTVSTNSLGLVIHDIGDSMDDTTENSIGDCRVDGRAYVDLEVSTTLPSTITLNNLVISREFK